MLLILKERIVVRDSDILSKSYNQILEEYCQTVDSYASTIVPRVGDVLKVRKSDDTPSMFYDVVSVIHCYNDAQFKYDDDMNTLSKHSYTVYVEVKKHVNTHIYQDNGYTFNEKWSLITELKDVTEK